MSGSQGEPGIVGCQPEKDGVAVKSGPLVAWGVGLFVLRKNRERRGQGDG